MQTLITKYKQTGQDKYYWVVYHKIKHLIMKEVQPYRKQPYREDLIQAGRMGLIKALQHIVFYDNNDQVLVYCKKYIKGEIMKELNRQKPYERALDENHITQKQYDILIAVNLYDKKLDD